MNGFEYTFFSTTVVLAIAQEFLSLILLYFGCGMISVLGDIKRSESLQQGAKARWDGFSVSNYTSSSTGVEESYSGS
jgi:hypothetical protein